MALYVELSLAGLPVQAQQLINVYDKHQIVGNCFADLPVNGAVPIELITVDALILNHHKYA